MINARAFVAAVPSPIRLGLSVLLLAGITTAGCVGPFDTRDFMTWAPDPALVREIERLQLEKESRSPTVTVEEASAGLTEDYIDELIKQRQEREAALPSIELTIEEVRAAALSNNLELEVQLIDPSIAETAVDAEEAKFESTFFASARRTKTDTPVQLATESSQATFDQYEMGVNIPLRTGGTATVSFPISENETDNLFATLNPAFSADVRFSISQPLLRNAGTNVNTYSIRVQKTQYYVAEAQTKLDAIRILANAERVYWRLYAAQRELDLRQQQYELAMRQLERARRRVEAGDAAEIEVLRAQSGVSERLEFIIIADTLVRKRTRDLKRIIDRDDLPMDSNTRVIIATLPSPVLLDLDPTALAEYAVANRMEMLEIELQIALASSTVDFRRNQKLPLVTLDYSYNIGGLGSTYNNAFDQIGDRSFEDWSLGIRADIPIGNEVAKANLHRAILERVQRLATRDERDQSIRREVYDALDTLRQNWQRILAARQDSILAGRTYEGEKRQFEVGARTSTDVLDAASRLAEGQSAEIQALADYQIAQIDLAFATGTLLGRGKIRWAPIDVPGDEDVPGYELMSRLDAETGEPVNAP